MSYAQCMRWQKKHPTGGKPQYMGFHTGYCSPQPPQKVSLKLSVLSNIWEAIGEMTVAQAFKSHPDAKRFARFGVYNEFRCDGPMAESEWAV